MVRRSISAAILSVACAIISGSPVSAQVSQTGYTIPLSLAVEAAEEAIRACEASSYFVTATVVDVSGVPKVALRGDHSTIHTRDTSFRKAYTAVTLGPIFKTDTMTAFAQLVGSSPSASSFLTIPNVIILPGAVVIKRGEEVVGALGVGGAPGGDKDEACAQAGLAKIRDRLAK